MPSRERLRSLASVLHVAAAVLLLAAAAIALSRRWSEVRHVLATLAPESAAYALGAVVAGSYCSFMSWKSILGDLGGSVSVRSGLRVYFVGQLAKYIPGSVWQPLTQMELGRHHGVARRVTVVSSAVGLLIVLGTGILAAIVCLPFIGTSALSRYFWVLPALPLIIVLLYPPVLNRVLSAATRMLRREAMPKPLSLRAVASASAWAVAVWLLYGLHIWVLARSVNVSSRGLFALATAAFAFAWVVGFLVIVAPAGAVAREAALIVLLHRSMPIAEATTIALVSRLLFTVADLGWGVAGAAVGGRGAQLDNQPEPPE